MDTGVRLQRYIIQEWGTIYNIPALNKGILATLVAVGACLLLAFGAGGGSGSGGLVIWPLFGSTNQILAGITLLIITVMLIKLGRPARYTMVPMVFVLVISFWAGAVKLIEFFRDGNWLLVAIDAIVLVTSLLVMLEAASVIARFRRSGSLSEKAAP
jgi:carbon starvation protein